jgi:hypothetical protein
MRLPGGFVGNFTSKEKKDYLCSHVTVSGWKNIMQFDLETREFRETYTTGFQEFMNIHSSSFSLYIFVYLFSSFSHSLNIFLALLDLWFSRQKLADISDECTASIYRIRRLLFAECFLDLLFDTEDGDLTFLWNVYKLIPEYTASHPRSSFFS